MKEYKLKKITCSVGEPKAQITRIADGVDCLSSPHELKTVKRWVLELNKRTGLGLLLIKEFDSRGLVSSIEALGCNHE